MSTTYYLYVPRLPVIELGEQYNGCKWQWSLYDTSTEIRWDSDSVTNVLLMYPLSEVENEYGTGLTLTEFLAHVAWLTSGECEKEVLRQRELHRSRQVPGDSTGESGSDE